MIIVAGHILVAPEQRGEYLRDCMEVVAQARNAAGCLDFTLSADLLTPGRVNIFERWQSTEAVEAFRGAGPSDEQQTAMISASVAEYEVTLARELT